MTQTILINALGRIENTNKAPRYCIIRECTNYVLAFSTIKRSEVFLNDKITNCLVLSLPTSLQTYCPNVFLVICNTCYASCPYVSLSSLKTICFVFYITESNSFKVALSFPIYKFHKHFF